MLIAKKTPLTLFFMLSITFCNVSPKKLNLIASGVVAAIIFKQSDNFKDEITEKLTRLKYVLRDLISGTADTIQDVLPVVKKLYAKIYDKKLKNEGKWFVSRWFKTQKATSDLDLNAKEIVDGLQQEADAIDGISHTGLRNTIKSNYGIVKGSLSIIAFLLTNNLLNRINK